MSTAADAAGPHALQTVPIGSVSDELRDRVRAIYETAFPAYQREPFEKIVAGSGDGDVIAIVGVQQGEPVGFAFLSSLDDVGHLFLEYFAVAADRRGAGVGQALWSATAGALAGRPVVLEVEDPAESAIDAAEVEQRVRRVRFWERVGARMLPVAGYVVPKLGEHGVVPLLLMWMPGSPGTPEPAAEALCDLVVALYEAGYGLDADDPLVARAKEHWGT